MISTAVFVHGRAKFAGRDTNGTGAMSTTLLLSTYLFLLLVVSFGELLIQTLNLKRIVENLSRGAEGTRQALLYSKAKAELAICQSLASAIYLFAFVSSGSFGIVERWLYQKVGGIFFGPLYLIAVAVLLSLPSIPFQLYSRFAIEERFGFNKMTFKQWLGDELKGLSLLVTLGAGFFALLLWAVSHTGDSWWIAATVAIGACQLLLLYIFPLFISPLFNRFTPLEDRTTKGEIEEMLSRRGYVASEILVMDGSARSPHPNAYFTGFKGSKRIVLFDTLLEKLTSRQVVAVVAHELGHEKLKHTLKTLVFSLVATASLFFIAGIVSRKAEVYFAFGFTIPSAHALLALLFFAFPVIVAPFSPLFSLISRRFEYQADAFAAQCGMKRELIEALSVLNQVSLTNPSPHPLYKFYYYSHPTLEERIEALER